MNTKHSSHTLHIVIAAMFAAMIAVMTAFVQIKTPTGGYVHLGDSMIYLTACFLPMPYAVAASAIGGGIADLLVYPETIIYTIIIKALNAVFFSAKDNKLLTDHPLGTGHGSRLFSLQADPSASGGRQLPKRTGQRIMENAGERHPGARLGADLHPDRRRVR